MDGKPRAGSVGPVRPERTARCGPGGHSEVRLPDMITRRRFLARGGLAGAVLLGGGATILSACGDDDDDSSTSGGGGGDSEFGELSVQLSWI